MITKKLQDAINEQINAEMWSANLYLSMSFYFDREGLTGAASWMKKQYSEEMEHACRMADYLVKRGGNAEVRMINVVPTGWGSALEVFEHAYKHECHVSGLINLLIDLAVKEKDKATEDFYWEFVREQVEEEATAMTIVEKLRLAGTTSLLYVDSYLGQRV